MTVLHTIDTVVIGAGHAGLAVSRLLTAAGREHVVLDRGRVGERWRTARWDSLHLLSPNWLNRLPAWQTAGDPEGFLSSGEFVGQLESYAASFDAPVLTGTTVTSLTTAPSGGYEVRTDHATWRARSVVVATGPHGVPVVPAAVANARVRVLTSDRYRNPHSLDRGGVLVVGASASGVQIADELARSGRDVVLAVGRHARVPRRYRGMDIFWWLETTGRLARTIDQVRDSAAARGEPSLQLVGRSRTDEVASEVDLAALQRLGVRLTGRLESLDGRDARFGDQLAALTAAADRRMHDLLDSIDRYVDRVGLTREVLAPVRPKELRTAPAPSRLDLHAERVRTVVLATGSIRQTWGVTDAPGVYVVGQRFQHRRDSGFIGGARHDAAAVVHHLTSGTLPVAHDEHTALTGEDSA